MPSDEEEDTVVNGVRVTKARATELEEALKKACEDGYRCRKCGSGVLGHESMNVVVCPNCGERLVVQVR